MLRLHHGGSVVLLLLLLTARGGGEIGTATSGLVGCSSGAAVLSQLQHRPVALATGGTVKAVGPVVMDPLVVAEVPGQAEGLPTQVAHVALLTMDPHVVTQ